MTRIFPFLIALILATTLALAADIAAVSPLNGATALATDRISFSIGTSAVIESCQLIVDGETVRNTAYGEQLRGRTISYPLVEGSHSWQVQCITDNGTTLATIPRTYTYSLAEASDVKVTSNGIFRGSLTHEFKFRNSPEQRPVVVSGLAAGDFVSILFSIPPSTITKELYVKQVVQRNGTAYLLLTVTKANDKYEVKLGENVTVNISKSQIILHFDHFERNKVTLVFSPTVHTMEAPPVETPQPEETPQDTAPETPVEQPEPVQPPMQTPPEQSEGAFKRFITWLSNVFG
jgi:hypothetical protein